MAGGVARDFLNTINGVPVLPPSFVTTFYGPINRMRMPLPASWDSVYGVIVPIFCRVALPNQAHWFFNLCLEESPGVSVEGGKVLSCMPSSNRVTSSCSHIKAMGSSLSASSTTDLHFSYSMIRVWCTLICVSIRPTFQKKEYIIRQPNGYGQHQKIITN